MFERLVLGVDPGLAVTGLAAIAGNGRRSVIVSARTIRTPAALPEAERLAAVYRAVRAALTESRAETVAVERLMWGRNVGSAMAVARASGVVLLAAAEAGVPVHEYAPLEVKMAVTGNGVARKVDVRRALHRLHGIDDLPTEPDAADAVAVAVCHLQQARPVREAAR